ncbi:MAG TPA: hypothetical protein EYN66_10435, partial [Myxococcales bacterium]|nr:hypothetical protein [Myxococcales bacterium]
MDRELSIALEAFVESLKQDERAATVQDSREAFRDGIMLCEALQNSKSLSGPEYDRLKRFVADSLPWTEDVLRYWQIFQ